MNIFVCTLFVVVFFIEFLTGNGTVPRLAVLVPELLAGVAVLVVVARLVSGKRIALSAKYLILLGILSLVMLVGIVAQSVGPGPIIAGMRTYLKYLPFFFLPAVYRFSDSQLKSQFIVLALLLAIQAPLSVYQRFVQYSDSMHTGDYIRGTLTDSGSLSLLALCGVAMIMALYLRRKIGILLMALACMTFFLPTLINETKVTLVLLPVVLLGPMFFMPNRKAVFRKFLPVIGVGGVITIAFIAVYDYLAQFNRYAPPVAEFLSDRSAIFYLYTGASSIDRYGYVGRVDGLILAWTHSLEDPFRFVFGLGIGNASESMLASFTGRYAFESVRYGADLTQISQLIWEVGFAGLIIYLVIFLLLFRDAKSLAAGTDFTAILGQFWSTVMFVMAFGLLYSRVFDVNEFGYLFWFFAGVIVSRKHRATRSAQSSISPSANKLRDTPQRVLGVTSPAQ